MKKIIVGLVAGSLFSVFSYASDELEQRVNDLELKTLLNKVRIQGEIDNFVDHYKVVNAEEKMVAFPPVSRKVNANQTLFRLRGVLDFSAEVTDYLKAYSSLVFKNHYTATGIEPSNSSLLSGGYPDYNSYNAVFEKAYIDLTAGKVPLVVSLGRLPTMFGPPANIKDGISRQSTYPMFAYSYPLDGVALTFNFKQYLGQDLSLRAVYSPFDNFYQSSAYLPFQSAQSGIIRPAHVLAFMAEYETRQIPYIEKFNVISQFNQIKFNGFTDFPDNTRNFVVPIGGVNYSMPGQFVSDSALMNINSFTNYVEFENIASLGFTLYGEHNYSKITPKGYAYYKTPVSLTSLGSVLSNNLEAKHGSAYIIGGKYEIPYFLKTSLGAELTGAGKYAFTPGFADDQLIGFYKNLRGRGYHAYINQPIFGSSNVRVGYYKVMRDFTDNTLGEPVDSNARIHDIYVTLKVRF